MAARVRTAALLAALVAVACHAAPCPSTDVEPVADGFVLAASDGPFGAWVVAPDCEVTTLDFELEQEYTEYDPVFETPAPGPIVIVPQPEPEAVLVQVVNVLDHVVSRVQSLPKFLHGLRFLKCPTLTHGADFTSARFFEFVSITDCPSIKTLDNIKFTDSMARILVHGTNLAVVDNVQWPMKLKQLNLSANHLTSIASIGYPEFLTTLDVSGNPITTLEHIRFPTELRNLALPAVTSVKNVTWPHTLKALTIEAATITNFELRASDFTALREMLGKVDAKSSQSTCADPTAKLETVNGKNFCVISDARFEDVYTASTSAASVSVTSNTTTTSTPKPTPSSPAKGLTTSGGSGAGSDQDGSSLLEDATLSEPLGNGLRSPNKHSTTADGEVADDETASSETNSDGTPSGKKRNGTTTKSNTRSSQSSNTTPSSGSSTDPSASNESTTRSSSSSSTILAATGGAIGTLAVLMLFVVVRRRSTQQLTKDDGSLSPSFTQLPSTPGSSSIDEPGPRVGFVANDVRNDALLTAFCLDTNQITIGKTIARGGFGIIFRGTYGDRAVAIKQMLPDVWRNDATLARFMDEIRLCASLQHPQIVEFVGIAWTSLRDLSVVTELMHRGDLHDVLRQHTAPQPEDWQQPWTPAKLQNKTAIARDVADAVVYLHSRLTPILHRDLKARNVLMGDTGNAKLSDFGISREVAIDVTMTSEIGTAAWIAPEVLRGERYSEKADVYSFGVLLVEMDTGRHPFTAVDGSSSENQSMSGTINSNNAFKHANMMLLVSTGTLRPTPSTACPLTIQSLVQQCLSFDARERPTANEVAERLRGLASSN